MKLQAIIWVTFLEVMRQPIYLVLFVCGLAMLLLSQFMTFFAFREGDQLYRDIGLATILLIGVFVAVYFASTSLEQDIEKRIAVTTLSKPVSREKYFLGKYFGIVSAAGLLMLVLGLILVPNVWFFEIKQHYRDEVAATFRQIFSGDYKKFNIPFKWSLFQAVYAQLLEVMVLAAFSLMLSTRLKMSVNVIATFVLYAFGHTIEYFYYYLYTFVKQARGSGEFIQKLLRYAHRLLPNFEYANIAGDISLGKIVQREYFVDLTLYNLAFATFFILLGFHLLRKREVL